MANEFKIKKGLIVTGASGGTVVDIQGSQGQLFSVTDNLSGSIFAVSDISGVPIFDVNSSGLSTFAGLVSGITPVNAANFVTKAYADGLTPGAGVFLPLAGGTMNTNAAITMTGSLTTTDNVTASRFYDKGNALYYGDFAGTSQFNHVKINSTLSTRNFVAGSYGYILEQSTTTANPVTFRFDNQQYVIYAGGGIGAVVTFLENGNTGFGATSPVSTVQIAPTTTEQTTAALTDAGSRKGLLTLSGLNNQVGGAGGGIVFAGNTTTSYAAIKGLLTNGGGGTQGDIAFSTRNAQTDTALIERMRISSGGAIKFNNYGAGTLVTDGVGNITASTSGPGTGTVTGSGTDNTVPLWNGTTGLDNSAITQTSVGAISINETSPANATEFNIKAIQSYCSMRMKGAAGSGADIAFLDNLTFLAGISGVPGGSMNFKTSTSVASNGLALSLNNIQEARFYGSGIDGTMENPISFTTNDSGIAQENRIRSSVSQTRASNILKFETATNTVGTFNENQLVLNGMGTVGINTDTMTGLFNVEVPMSTSGVGSDFRIVGGSGYGMRNLSVEIPGYGSGIKIYSPTSSSVDNGAMTFYQQTTSVGGININTSSTSYNTTSDYRLKENREDISDAIERVKELKPIKFNWIKEPGESKVDGFYAHELAEVVPEAVTGEKDALDWEGNPEYQSIDQAKIVPLLTAALQQAIDKIEALEVRIQTLENK